MDKTSEMLKGFEEKYLKGCNCSPFISQNIKRILIKGDKMKIPEKIKTLLLVGDSFFIPDNFADFFERQNFHIVSIGSEVSEILAGIRLQPEIIIVDFEMRYNDPYLVISILHKALPASLIAIMNGHSNHCNSVEAKFAGAKIIVGRTCDGSAFNEVIHQTEEEVFF